MRHPSLPVKKGAVIPWGNGEMTVSTDQGSRPFHREIPTAIRVSMTLKRNDSQSDVATSVTRQNLTRCRIVHLRAGLPAMWRSLAKYISPRRARLSRGGFRAQKVVGVTCTRVGPASLTRYREAGSLRLGAARGTRPAQSHRDKRIALRRCGSRTG